MGKQGKRDKSGWSHVNGLMVSTVVWPCPAPDDCTACPVIFLNSISNYFPGSGDSVLCACVCIRCVWSQITAHRASMPMVPATGDGEYRGVSECATASK